MIECTKTGVADTKWIGTCKTCKAEFKADRDDLKKYNHARENIMNLLMKIV